MKCKFAECKKAASRGTIFQQPEMCKDHATENMITVKKKCGNCNNAVSAKVENCTRCMAVYADIDSYREKKIAELNSTIDTTVKSLDMLTIANRPSTPGIELKKKKKSKNKPETKSDK